MYYRGVTDANFAALCPIVMTPGHWVVEDVVYTLGEAHRRRKRARRALGTALHKLHLVSRTFVGGAALAAGLGVLASVPLVARILFPRRTAGFRRIASRVVEAPSITRLRFAAQTPHPVPKADKSASRSMKWPRWLSAPCATSG